jgi:hypothetical protein
LPDGGAAQPAATGALPLRRLALFSSGVGFFEHGGALSGPALIDLPFNVAVIDDVLKSLTINDPLSSDPQVSYPSEQTLYRTLKSLSIDLSGTPGMAEILAGLRGVEIDVYAPNLISGRIIGVEYRTFADADRTEPVLSLLTAQGIKTVALKDTGSFAFKDQRINADLNRALDLIMASRASDTRNLTLTLSGSATRTVSLSYVIPAPVWKVSYRLDLSAGKPLLQGWAIVDNDSDTDWNNVELSLVTGRPVSFIQHLYAPYRLSRPVLPLAIAGIADAPTYDSGWEAPAPSAPAAPLVMKAAAPRAALREEADMAYESSNLAGGVVETAAAQSVGDQFEFTIKKPVSLARQQSAMLPLVESSIQAEKTLVFSGAKAANGGTIHPSISAELTNTAGMKLPAGPITVYDGGIYAGDALIAFFPENEKRLISYGDDLSVTGSVTTELVRSVTSVTLSGGVMVINRKQTYGKTYTFKNASGEQKRLIVEHPITRGTILALPQTFSERTDTVYRFVQTLAANATLSFIVQEESPLAERITLAQLRPESFVSYVSNQELPAPVRAALQKAIELKKKADDAAAALVDDERERTRLIGEQERVRQNLAAAGNQTPQGQDYLKRLSDLDAAIDAQSARIDAARTGAQSLKNDYDAYVAGLKL